jgi:ParB family transcriptional regulator, chromosome partitioning protein
MNKTDNPRKALGKGLGALLPTRAPTAPPAPPAAEPRAEFSLNIALDLIDPNPHQPRRMFQSDKLSELAQSIRANGIIQPLVVRKSGDRFQLVAGERRWRAAKIAGITEVPIVVRDVPDERLLEITLIENIQREDLNPVETATAFARMSTELSLSPDQIGMRTGKDRSTVVNFIRLLQLPVDIQQLIAERRLTAGHARCLLTLPDLEMQRTVAAKAVEQGWSVRQLENATQKLVEGRRPKETAEVRLDPNVKDAIQEMERTLGTKVRVIERAKGAGRIEIDYYSQDDLDRIYAVIVGENEIIRS